MEIIEDEEEINEMKSYVPQNKSIAKSNNAQSNYNLSKITQNFKSESKFITFIRKP